MYVLVHYGFRRPVHLYILLQVEVSYLCEEVALTTWLTLYHFKWDQGKGEGREKGRRGLERGGEGRRKWWVCRGLKPKGVSLLETLCCWLAFCATPLTFLQIRTIHVCHVLGPSHTDGTEDDCLPCTPDELASLVREIQDSPPCQDPHLPPLGIHLWAENWSRG